LFVHFIQASSEASELDDITSDVMQSLFLISGATFKELAKELRPLKNCEIGIYLEKIILNLKRKSDVILKVIQNTFHTLIKYDIHKFSLK